MSYLGVPRIHVMGLFYTAPGNLNNDIDNYDPANPLNYNTGRYKYPDGTAQLWLEGCVVTSVVGLDGAPCSDPARDSLVGARVTSPSPEIPKEDGHGGLYALAKMADLDPSMQFRSEVYGLRIYVDIENGGGFSGEIALPPQLRDLWFGRGDGGMTGNQVAVGTWHPRLTNLTWTEPTAPSPVLEALRARGGAGLDVKMGVDLFQTARANQFTQGDRFGYGRLVAAIGPASADEPAQIVPGRRLYTPKTFDSEAKAMTKAMFTRQAGEEAMSSEDPGLDWNRTDLRVCTLQDGRTVLLVDLFNSAPLTKDRTGKFDTGKDVKVGWLDGDLFTPLANGGISLDRYIQLDAQTRKLKDVWWPEHAAILQIELTDADIEGIKEAPIAIQADGSTVVRENPNGVYLNIDRATARLEPNASDSFDVFAYQYGLPSGALPPNLSLETALYNDTDGSISPTTIFKASLDPSPTGPGRFQLRVTTGPAVALTPVRKPLDSFLCYLTATGTGYLIGEAMTLKPQTGPPSAPLFSLLFWQDHQVVEQPTWAANIGPLMQSYARLYPGMKSILDISDPTTFKAFAAPLRSRFELDRNDPGCMPVTRDMSPATLRMMLRFLDGLMKEHQT